MKSISKVFGSLGTIFMGVFLGILIGSFFSAADIDNTFSQDSALGQGMTNGTHECEGKDFSVVTMCFMKAMEIMTMGPDPNTPNDDNYCASRPNECQQIIKDKQRACMSGCKIVAGHACCSGCESPMLDLPCAGEGECINGTCTVTMGGGTTAGGATGGATGGTGGTSAPSCTPNDGDCSDNSECCSGFCEESIISGSVCATAPSPPPEPPPASSSVSSVASSKPKCCEYSSGQVQCVDVP